MKRILMDQAPTRMEINSAVSVPDRDYTKEMSP